MKTLVVLSCLLSLASCKGANAPDDEPVVLYGVGGLPREAPANCKELGRIEASSQSTDSIPEGRLRSQAQELGGNAAHRIRKNGKEEGFLGFTYHYKAIALRCPRPKTPAAAASSGPAPQNAVPAASASAAEDPSK